MDQALKTMIDNLPEKTGKSLEEWFSILETKEFEKHGQGLNILKKEYGVTHGFANTIVSLFRSRSEEEEDLVATQYKGKEDLLPIYNKLISIVNNHGGDIQIVPKKGSVSIIRKRQYALIKPATKTRIDLGLKIKDKAPQGKLENSGPFGAMCTHRVKLSNVDDINSELLEWLQEAYDKSV